MSIEELARQRDTLLAALQMIASIDMDVRQCRKTARVAIAAAAGAAGLGNFVDLIRATNQYYPLPRSSRSSTMDRARDERIAFRFGWVVHATLDRRSVTEQGPESN